MATIGITLSECPTNELLSPCVCFEDYIGCYGKKVENIDKLFDKFNRNLRNNRKTFTKFSLIKTNTNEINENIFKEITFNIIYISNNNLTKINTNAFNGTNDKVIDFYLLYCRVFTDVTNLFDILNQFINIERIYLMDINLKTIPDNAFKQLNQLKEIYIYDPNVKTLGQNVFIKLNKLENLFIFGNYKNVLKNQLVLSNNSELTLNLRLKCKQISNESVFENESLSNIGRPTNLKCEPNFFNSIENPKIVNKYYIFDENIFKPYFMANNKNQIVLYDRNEFCNLSENQWIEKSKEFKSRILISRYNKEDSIEEKIEVNCN